MTVVRPHLQWGVAELGERRPGRRLRREAAQRALDQRRLLLLRAGRARLHRRGQRARARAAARRSPPTASSAPTATRASGTAWTPTRTRSCSTTSGPSGEAPWRVWDAAGAEAPVKRALVTGGHGFVASHLARALLERGDAVTVLDLAPPPLSGLTLQGIAPEVELVEADLCDAAAGRRHARRRRVRRRLPPRRPDPGRAGDGRPGRRPSRPTCAAPGPCSRPAARADVPARRRRLLRQGLRPQRGAALPRGHAAAPGLAVRGEQGGRRRDRAQLPARLRAAGRGHPLRQHLRRRRPQLLPPDPGSGRRRARRPPPRRSAPTAAPSATSSTSTTRSPPTWRSSTRSAPAARAAGEAFNAGGERPHSVAEVLETIAAVCRRRPRARIPRHRQPGRRDRPPVRRLGEAARADRLAPGGRARATAWRRTLEWYRDHPEARP